MTNIIIIQGRLASDPKLYERPQGAFYEFNLVHENEYASLEDDTQLYRVRCTNKTAEIAQKYCRKGDMVDIIGHLTYTEWTGSDGRKLKDYSIIATSIDFCSSSRRDDGGCGYDQGDELPA